MKPKSKKINHFTGKPRKWVCPNNAGIDMRLEEAETFYFYSFATKGKQSAWDAMPAKILEQIIESHEMQLEKMREALARKDEDHEPPAPEPPSRWGLDFGEN